jgi:hypothetical protein
MIAYMYQPYVDSYDKYWYTYMLKKMRTYIHTYIYTYIYA